MKKSTTHNLTVAAMLSAVAFILMFIEFPIPMLIPSFVKMDFSDLPALLGAFALGPVYGVVISFMKNLLHIVIKGTSTACVGAVSYTHLTLAGGRGLYRQWGISPRPETNFLAQSIAWQAQLVKRAS